MIPKQEKETTGKARTPPNDPKAQLMLATTHQTGYNCHSKAWATSFMP